MIKPGLKVDSPWSIDVEVKALTMTLKPGQCVSAGSSPRGYSARADGSEIVDDEPYSFDIASPSWGKHRTRNHTGFFCLRRSVRGIDVVNIVRGAAPLTVEICSALLDTIVPAKDVAH